MDILAVVRMLSGLWDHNHSLYIQPPLLTSLILHPAEFFRAQKGVKEKVVIEHKYCLSFSFVVPLSLFHLYFFPIRFEVVMKAIKFAAFAAVLASVCDAIHLIKRTGPPAVVGLRVEKHRVRSNSLQPRAASMTLSQTLDNNVRHTTVVPLEHQTNWVREIFIMPMSR